MSEEMARKIREMAGHICQTHATIRQTAKVFGYSKSTIHKYVSVKLKSFDMPLYEETKKVLDDNFANKHIRGGESTKRKYADNKNQENC